MPTLWPNDVQSSSPRMGYSTRHAYVSLLLGHESAHCRILGGAPCLLIFLDEFAADVDDDLTGRAGELERRLVCVACYGSARVIAARGLL